MGKWMGIRVKGGREGGWYGAGIFIMGYLLDERVLAMSSKALRDAALHDAT